MINAVVFDFGDTLLGRAGAGAGLRDAAGRLGADVAPEVAEAVWEEIQAKARTPQEMAKGRDLSAEAHREHWLALYGVTESIVAGLAEVLYEREISPGAWLPFPDSLPTLQELTARGVPIGVLSDTGFDIRPVLARHGMDRFVRSWVLSYEHGVAKPARVLFETACRELGSDPGETLMVGDSHHTDGGAIEAGMRAYLLPRPVPGEPRGLDLVLRLIG